MANPETMSPAAQRPGPVAASVDELAELYEQHFAFVWRTLLRLGVPEAAAEDVAQDVFLVLRRRLGAFDRSRSMRAWLFGICRRIARDHRRGDDRAERRVRLAPVATAVRAPDDEVSLQEGAAMVQRFLDDLDEVHRDVFVLSELEGMSGTEIAEALAVNRNTVYTRLRAARRKFEEAAERHLRGEA